MNLADYRFTNYRLDALQFQTHSYMLSYLWEFYTIQCIFYISIFSFAFFIPYVFAFRFYSSLCHDPCTCASVVTERVAGSTLRLATTARFYITIRKKSNSVRSTTCRVVAHLLSDTRLLFPLLYLHERNRPPSLPLT